MIDLNAWAHALTNWEWGSTRSEQLCADYLITEGYLGIDPRAPRGGPDGGIDICFQAQDGSRSGGAACYFPTHVVDNGELVRKFRSDLKKAQTLGLSMFVFMTGQRISRATKDQLAGEADISVHFVDYDCLHPRAAQLSQYVGNAGSAVLTDSARRDIDFKFVCDVVQRCFFFDILPGLEYAPRRIGIAISLNDDLLQFFNVGRPFPSNQTLADRIRAWVSAWHAVTEKMFPYDEDEGQYGDRYTSDGRNWVIDVDLGTPQGQAYYKDMERLVNAFRAEHVIFTNHLNSEYPDVLRIAPSMR